MVELWSSGCFGPLVISPLKLCFLSQVYQAPPTYLATFTLNAHYSHSNPHRIQYLYTTWIEVKITDNCAKGVAWSFSRGGVPYKQICSYNKNMAFIGQSAFRSRYMESISSDSMFRSIYGTRFNLATVIAVLGPRMLQHCVSTEHVQQITLCPLI